MIFKISDETVCARAWATVVQPAVSMADGGVHAPKSELE